MKLNLLDLASVVRAWGRGVVFYATRWDPGTGAALALTHLGDTEGDIVLTPNAEVANLTLPEISGPAVHEADYTGENPTLEIPLYLADPALHAIVNPIASASAGGSIRRAVTEYMLALFPEQLFVLPDAGGRPTRYELEFAGGAWTLNGLPLTADKQTLLDLSLWLWRGHFARPPRSFKGGAGSDKKIIEKVTFQVMDHEDMPEGFRLYCAGDPADAGIDIEGGS